MARVLGALGLKRDSGRAVAAPQGAGPQGDLGDGHLGAVRRYVGGLGVGIFETLESKGAANQMNRDSGNCVGARRWCERFTTPIVKAETRRLSILSKTPRRAKSNDW